MKKAYIILAHKNAAQVMRLIKALDDNQATFFLHLDKKADVAAFRKIISHKKVIAIKSVPTPWGGFGLVEATLQAITTALNCKQHFNFITLLSGQHYPIKSKEYIHDFLSNTTQRAFIEYTSIPNEKRWQPRGGLYRIDRYFFGLQAHERYRAKTLNFLLRYFSFFNRKHPLKMVPYGGSQWWTLDHYSLQYILQFVKDNEDYVQFHKQTFAPDELFFHTILLNAKDDEIRRGIVNNNLLYLNWANKDKGHPEVLRCTDFNVLMNSDALFARKFDTVHDAAVLDMIDEQIGEEIPAALSKLVY